VQSKPNWVATRNWAREHVGASSVKLKRSAVERDQDVEHMQRDILL
jgi:hypothetical protein